MSPARVLLFCWLGWAFDFYDLVLFAFVKAAVQRDLALSLEQLALVDGLTFAAAAIGGVGFGRFADRSGRRRALTSCIVLFSLGTLLTGYAAGFPSLCAARILVGLGVGGEWGVGHAAVAEAHVAERRNRAAALLQSATPVGLMLAAIVGCFVAPAFGWRAAFIASAAPAVLVVMARWAMPDAGERTSQVAPRVSVLALLDARHRSSTLRLFWLLVLHMTGFWSCYAWLPSLLLREGHSLAFIGRFHIALAAVHLVADLAFGRLADRFGRARVFVISSLSTALGLALLAISLGAIQGDAFAIGVALAAIGLGAGTWSAFGTWFAECYAPPLRATAAASLYNLARGSQLLAQPLLAALFALTGTLSVALWLGVVCAFAAALSRLPSAAETDQLIE